MSGPNSSAITLIFDDAIRVQIQAGHFDAEPEKGVEELVRQSYCRWGNHVRIFEIRAGMKRADCLIRRRESLPLPRHPAVGNNRRLRDDEIPLNYEINV